MSQDSLAGAGTTRPDKNGAIAGKKAATRKYRYAEIVVIAILLISLLCLILRQCNTEKDIIQGTTEESFQSNITVETLEETFPSSKILSDWYFAEYDRTGIEIAVLADVTHDGQPELIAVAKDENGFSDTGNIHSISITGSVYFVDADGAVCQIETYSGGEVHNKGFFAWYLKKAEIGYNLIQETFSLWPPGFGELHTTEYYLDPDGNRITVNSASVYSGDREPVTEEALEKYSQEGNIILNNSSLLYRSNTNIGGDLIPMDDGIILERAVHDNQEDGLSSPKRIASIHEHSDQWDIDYTFIYDGAGRVVQIVENRSGTYFETSEIDPPR